MSRLLWMTVVMFTVGSQVVAQRPGDAAVEVPLGTLQSRLVVSVQETGGAEYRFALSTANAMTVLSASLAERLGEGAQLTLGGLPVPLEDHATVPDKDLAEDGVSIDGMIGAQMLNQFDVLIDVPGGRLMLKPIGRAVQWDGMTMSDPVRLRVYHGVFLALDVELNGQPFAAMLDVGTSALVVNEPVQTTLALERDDRGTLGLGTITMPDLPVRVRELAVLDQWDPTEKGFVIVGAPIAYECAVSISWVHRELRTCVQ